NILSRTVTFRSATGVHLAFLHQATSPTCRREPLTTPKSEQYPALPYPTSSPPDTRFCRRNTRTGRQLARFVLQPDYPDRCQGQWSRRDGDRTVYTARIPTNPTPTSTIVRRIPTRVPLCFPTQLVSRHWSMTTPW